MKAVVQRVLKASVIVDGRIISSINEGLCVLIGISKNDTDSDMEYIAQKLLHLKIFENDEEGKKWKHSVIEKNFEILCVSQFTLYHTLKGNKMDFHNAMSAAPAEIFYNKFLQLLKTKYKEELIKDGKFGALMEVNIINNGPVTVQLESPKLNNEI